jgi:Putative binding domain, N-terminal
VKSLNALACAIAAAILYLTVPLLAAIQLVPVSTGTGCTWTAVSNVSWVTVTVGSSGTGNGTVNYSVGPYGGPPKKRAGTMTIAEQTFTVNQTK